MKDMLVVGKIKEGGFEKFMGFMQSEEALAERRKEADITKTLASVSPAIRKRDNVLKRKIDDLHCCDLIQSDTPFEFMKYNAAIYIVSVEYLKSSKLFKSDFQAYYEMSELNSLDVDTEQDLLVANCLMNSFASKTL